MPRRPIALAALLTASAALGTAAVPALARAPRAPRATSVADGTPLSVSLASVREVSTRYRTVQITGRVGPTASLAGGAGSIILYRQTRAGLQQLSFNGPQTHPKGNGAFSIKSTGEPTGHNTYVVVYVPSAQGYALQGVASTRLTISG